jgi:hypothetical protein
MITSGALTVVRDIVTEVHEPQELTAEPSGSGVAVVPPAGSTMKTAMTSSKIVAAPIGTRALWFKTVRFL